LPIFPLFFFLFVLVWGFVFFGGRRSPFFPFFLFLWDFFLAGGFFSKNLPPEVRFVEGGGFVWFFNSGPPRVFLGVRTLHFDGGGGTHTPGGGGPLSLTRVVLGPGGGFFMGGPFPPPFFPQKWGSLPVVLGLVGGVPPGCTPFLKKKLLPLGGEPGVFVPLGWGGPHTPRWAKPPR